ncbi:hypothetical protein EDB83DRAFT_2677433 [Lactarius deliciosus]|nr:hypothetical protein EDB83DRAFT_2677433 [Lactarius deliciosus]
MIPTRAIIGTCNWFMWWFMWGNAITANASHGFLMDQSSSPGQAKSREYQQQAIDAEIKSLEGSIRALKLRRNALTPISSLPTEVITTIFSFLIPVAPSPFTILGEKPDHLSWLRVARVCHHWREIALNQPLFWSHVDFTVLTSAGAAGVLALAKTAPLYLEARVPVGRWDDARFSAFQKELQARVSHICHLAISADHFHLRKTLEELYSPAPTLEFFSLSNDGVIPSRVFVLDTLFDGTTPRLSHLQLQKCDISWKSPLLKGLKYLEIDVPSRDARPSLTDWLDALDEMPQLKMLDLHSASPIAPPGALLSSGIERTITLASLAQLSISGSVRDCGLALAHLLLPALTRLYFTTTSFSPDGSDVQEVLPYVARHAHGPQDTQPLQSVFVRNDRRCADMLAWTKPNIEVKSYNLVTFFEAMVFSRVAISVTNEDWLPETHAEIFEAAMTALPIDGLVTLTSQVCTSSPHTQSWLRQAPRWPLLQRVRLATHAARGFTDMVLEDSGERECPLLPSLTDLVLVDVPLSARRTLRLCDALMKRVEQGVPLETLDLRTCFATSRTVELLEEIVVDVVGPEKTVQERAQMRVMWDSVARDLFIEDDLDSSGPFGEEEDYDEDDPDDTGSDHEVSDNWNSDGDSDRYDEDETDYW